MKAMQNKRKQLGLTLIELLVVLIFGGLALAAIGLGIQKVVLQTNMTNRTEMATVIYPQMSNKKPPTGYGTNNYNDYLNTMKLIGSNYAATGAGATLTLTNAKTGGVLSIDGTGTDFTISETLMPPADCTDWLTTTQGPNYKKFTVGTTDYTPPLNAALAKIACGNTASTATLTSAG